MRRLLKTLGNAAFVVGGFFIVFFTVSKTFTHDGQSVSGSNFGGIANADAPPSCAGFCDPGSCGGDSSGEFCGTGGDSAGDCGGDGDCGGGGGDCGK